MSGVSMQAIKELRERTQAGMSDCKGALEEASGDMEKAVEIILKKGKAKVAKRAGAIATEGEVRAAVSADRRSGAIVEVNSQTDFAARNDQFVAFVGEVLAAAEKAPAGSDINAAKVSSGKMVGEVAEELTAKIGEKITVRRWAKISVPEGGKGFVESYVHMGGKIGVLLLVEADGAAATAAPTRELAENTAMHIAAMGPQYLTDKEIPAADIEKQREIFTEQLRSDPKPKPEASWPKIVEGKLAKWFTEIALLPQESVVTPGQTIAALAEAAGKAAGGPVALKQFVRFERGEGLSKAADDFAAEVAKMAGN